MGANRWKSATALAAAADPVDHLLPVRGGRHARPQGRAEHGAAAGGQPADVYTYDPAYPAPSLGGHSCCGAQSGPQGPYDQTAVEQRSDVLVYSSAPLTADTEVTGPATVTCGRRRRRPTPTSPPSSTVVQPDGGVINLNDGIIRTSFRDSLSHPTPTTPGQPYAYQIQIWPTSYEFRAGDRIRVEISSSDYPQFAPNPNTGAPFGQEHRHAAGDADDPARRGTPVVGHVAGHSAR